MDSDDGRKDGPVRLLSSAAVLLERKFSGHTPDNWKTTGWGLGWGLSYVFTSLSGDTPQV